MPAHTPSFHIGLSRRHRPYCPFHNGRAGYAERTTSDATIARRDSHITHRCGLFSRDTKSTRQAACLAGAKRSTRAAAATGCNCRLGRHSRHARRELVESNRDCGPSICLAWHNFRMHSFVLSAQLLESTRFALESVIRSATGQDQDGTMRVQWQVPCRLQECRRRPYATKVTGQGACRAGACLYPLRY